MNNLVENIDGVEVRRDDFIVHVLDKTTGDKYLLQ